MQPPLGAALSWLLLAGIGVTALSGLPALLRSPTGERLAAGLAVLGSLCGLAAAAGPLAGAAGSAILCPLGRFAGEPLELRLDALGAFFLVPLFLVAGLAAIYGLRYWTDPASAPRLRLSCGILTAAMAVVVSAGSSLLLLVAWEIMALAGFFAATADDRAPEVREAGWVYLVATHTGTLALFAMVALLRAATGTFRWVPLAPGPEGLRATIFLLAFLGFGFKAGLVPIHFWLPGAHANAPSHVSALLSAVMLKMGVYGVLRVTQILPAPAAWWGALVLVAGLATAVTGILLALQERDLKRLLAYSSVENLGIIFLGLGLALSGRAAGKPGWVALGLSAALFHVWNHALFKSLLFFDAGALVHAHGSRDLESMGGLLRPLPRAGAAFALGSLAVCGLPPGNGFASEWLLYLGLFAAWTDATGGAAFPALAGLAVAGLALAGGLAVATFVKAFGVAFLGNPRRGAPAHPPHDAAGAMLLPLVLLAGLCALLGLLPVAAAPALARVATAWWPAAPGAPGGLSVRGPLLQLSQASSAVALVLVAVAAALWLRLRAPRAAAPQSVGAVDAIEAVDTIGTWDCGYAVPTARMQYTARSFAQWMGEHVAPGLLAPRRQIRRAAANFPPGAAFGTTAADPFLERVFRPALARTAVWLERLRIFQQGRLPIYLFYVFATLVALLGWVAISGVIGVIGGIGR